MSLSHARHYDSVGHEAEVPVNLPNVIITVATDGTLTAAVDGVIHPHPPAGAWTRTTFGPLMDEITKDRTVSVRVEVRECDGGVFTDIVHARKPAPTAVAAEHEPAPGTRRGRRAVTTRAPRLMQVEGDGFVPGEDVAVAIIYAHSDASPDGTARALLTAEQAATAVTGEVILLGRVSGALAISRLP